MRQHCMYGSARGAPGNRRPYRNLSIDDFRFSIDANGACGLMDLVIDDGCSAKRGTRRRRSLTAES